MKKIAACAACLSLLLVGCGDDDAGGDEQEKLADLLIAEGIFGADEQCLRDKAAELSEGDAQFLVENIDATSTEGFSAELQAWVDGLLDCIDLGEQDS